MQNKWLVLTVISAALFLIGIDMTVLYTALPTLTHELHATNSDKLWIINAYPLVMAGLLLGAGTLGDRVGHRLMFMLGLVCFGLASVFAAFTPSAGLLIFGRGLLAVGAAMMMPASLTLLRHTFTTEREQGIAIGVWGSVFSGAAAVGPLVGGYLLSNFWWGSVFLINVPVVLVALILTPLLVNKTPANPTRKWDLFSSILVMIGLVGLTFALKEVAKPDRDWLLFTAAAAIALLFIFWFVRRQGRLASPLVDFGLFRDTRFAAGVLTAIFTIVVLMGEQLVLTQRLQLVEGLSPLYAGLFMVPISLASFLAGPLIGSMLHKVGVTRALWVMLLVAAVGLIGFIGLYDGPLVLKLVSLAVFGFGSGAALSAASAAIMMSAPAEKAGMAGSLESISYELGGVIGVAVMGSIMTALYTANLIVPSGIADAALARDSLDQALLLAEGMTGREAELLAANARTAFDHAFNGVLLTGAAILVLLALGLAVFLRAPRQVATAR